MSVAMIEKHYDFAGQLRRVFQGQIGPLPELWSHRSDDEAGEEVGKYKWKEMVGASGFEPRQGETEEIKIVVK
jgi:hypothetical protein